MPESSHQEGQNMKTLLVAVAVLAGSIPVASGQTFPSRPVTLIVPFAAGGPVDTIARILSVPMGKTLRQPVLVESVTGAAGTLGVGRVARAAPDGYTLSIGHWSTHVINGAVYPIQYDLLKDLEPLAMIAADPLLIVAGAPVAGGELREVLGRFNSNPGNASAGTAGAGAARHAGGLSFSAAAG